MTTSTPSENDDVSGFGYGEHLVLWSWRRISRQPGCSPQIDGEFTAACREDGAEVLATLGAFLRVLGLASRRPLTIGTPGSLAVTADERQVLTLVAAAQADRPALFEAQLQWIARREQREVLRIAAKALAAALAANDLRLALPPAEPPVVCERAAATA